jgi:cytochrome c oxidase cbb3-type subunit 3
MSESEKQGAQKQGAVQTTGHAWDGDLQEFNNPLPNWWVWSFYATVLFALIYWVLYPAWPVASTYTKGVFNTITFTNDAGEEVTTHWNTRALLLRDMQEGKHAVRSREYMEQVAGYSYDEILADEEMLAFTRSVSRGLFGDNCAACHGAGGAGVMGLFPNLVDDNWLWGGTVEDIEHSIAEGRMGFMPAFRETFSDEQLEAVASYVLSMSGRQVDSGQVASGKQIFQGEAGGCYYCHTSEGTGMKSQGAPDLTNNIWSVALVSAAEDEAAALEAVKKVIRDGVTRQMPGWKERLSEEQIRLLTVYVHQLGGGQ